MPIVVAVLGVVSSLEEVNTDFDMIYRNRSGMPPYAPFHLLREIRSRLHYTGRDNSKPLLSCFRAVPPFYSGVKGPRLPC